MDTWSNLRFFHRLPPQDPSSDTCGAIPLSHHFWPPPTDSDRENSQSDSSRSIFHYLRLSAIHQYNLHPEMQMCLINVIYILCSAVACMPHITDDIPRKNDRTFFQLRLVGKSLPQMRIIIVSLFVKLRMPIRQPPYWFQPSASIYPDSTQTMGVPTCPSMSCPRWFLLYP